MSAPSASPPNHIAIDGPAGSGKSTLGIGLAKSLVCAYLDTGLMYREVTLRAVRMGIGPQDVGRVTDLATSIRFSISALDPFVLEIDGQPGASELRSALVDESVSAYSAVSAVRQIMVQRQREMAHDRSIVMVGRDIGTAVLPDADVKFWMSASAQERARRRLSEGLSAETNLTDKDMLARIQTRDDLDSGRDSSPMLMSPDAIVIDTSEMSPSEALTCALMIVERTVQDRMASMGENAQPADGN